MAHQKSPTIYLRYEMGHEAGYGQASFFKSILLFVITGIPIESGEVPTFENSFDMMLFVSSQF